MTMRTQTMELPVMTRLANVRSSSIDVEARTVEVVISTGARRRIRGWDADIEEEIPVTAEAVRLERLNTVGVVLDSHRAWGSAGDVIGAIERGSVRIEGKELVGRLRFARTEAADRIFALVQDDILRSVSVGYDAEYERIRAKDREDGGDVDLYRAVSWEPYEVSIVSMPADAGATIRGEDQPRATRTYRVLATQENDMPTRSQPPAAAPQTPPAQPAQPETPDAASAVARTLDQVVWFRGVLQAQGLDPSQAETLVRAHAGDDTSIRTAILAQVAARTAAQKVDATPPANVQMGADQADKTARAIGIAILQRAAREGKHDLRDALKRVKDSGIDVQDETVSRVARLGLLDMARMVLRAQGANVDMMSKPELAMAALHGRAGGMHTPSDFPVILEGVAHKYLLGRLEAVTVPYMEFYRTKDRPNFQEFEMIQSGSAPRLQKLRAGAEIKRGSWRDGQRETGKLESYATSLVINRQLLINDSLGAFTDVMDAMGDAVTENREFLAMSPFISNPTLKDGSRFFDAAKFTDLVAVYGAPSKTVLVAAGEMMANQIELVDNGATDEKRRLARRPGAWIGSYRSAIALEELLAVPFTPSTMSEVRSPRFNGHPVYEFGGFADLATKPYFAIDLRNSGLFCGGLEGGGVIVKQESELLADGISIAIIDDFYAAIAFRGGVLRCHTTNPAG